jgi:hypothetical protein
MIVTSSTTTTCATQTTAIDANPGLLLLPAKRLMDDHKYQLDGR